MQAELLAAMARVGVEGYSPKGEPFDPNVHEAMAQQPVDGAESGTVVEVYQQGYRLTGDVVIRPARVIVAALMRGPLHGPRASTRRRRPTRSRRRTASSCASTTPTATRATPKAEERFKEVQHAYDVLGDPDKRKQYDRGGFNPFAGGGGAGGRAAASTPARSATSSPTSSAAPAGGGARPRRAAARSRAAAERGRDLETEVSLSFEQAVEGAQVSLQVPMSPDAARRAAAPAPSRARRPKVCPRCQGRGVESQGQGLFSISQPCSQCGGSGTVIEDPCPTCTGIGRDADGQEVPREHPRRRARGQPHPPRRQGRARAQRRRRRATCSSSPTSPTRRCSSARASNLEVEVPLTIPEALRGARDRGADAQRAQAPARPARARSTARSSACAARARRGSTARAAATSTTASCIDVPDKLTPRAGEGGRASSSEVMNGNPRARLFA